MNSYAEDCVHLHACRRLCKIAKVKSRGCNAETCTAYESYVEDAEWDDFEELDGLAFTVYYGIKCSGCGWKTGANQHTQYCPNCGAFMTNGGAE